MKITITGVERVNAALTKLGHVEWDPIQEKQADAMENKSDAVVPVDTGALRDSATFENGEFGYTVDYAPHVNYGHATRGGGFVPGRHFLEEVVNSQEQNYKDEVLKYLKETVL